ncbi:major facilitator superfamily domain-containing protein [Microdochium trichocladiopsis]|uniref:Major facilitator superfamily domain-containing protein n=1 Tax=Microdochium trichocladiopsis TaxID=1682393 RepID=A0A9P8XW77_9PEZI|nr:major facilitator superfamily domain-containing protein [Microdochium trichocladiopsis]KAH7024359.1 major facilitator superfamily domain-containing protein [Microdochium trichocladiopsis]
MSDLNPAQAVSADAEKKIDADAIKKSTTNIDTDVEIDLKAGQSIVQLDESELFLQQHGIPRSRLAELLAADANGEAERKLRKRVDWMLLPLLCGTYMLQYIDKQALGYAAVFDLFTSTGMTSDQYSWMASIFYFSYLLWEWPSSYLAQKLPTGKVIAAFVFCWGSIMLITVASKDFAGMAACRFFLGAFEAVITPAFMLIVAQWYKRDEQPARAGAFYCFNGFGSMVGGILFYGVGQAKGWDIWRIIYVLCGGMTVVWGVVLWFFLPDSIYTAKRFTVEEKTLLLARTVSNQTGTMNRTIKKEQIFEVFRDPQVWLLFLYVLLNETINGGIANFSKLIVKGFTSDPLLTTAYGIPYGACNAVYMFFGPFVASRFKNVRTLVMIAWLMPTLVASCLFWQLPRSNKGGLLAGYYICASYVGGLIVALQMPAANIGGYTKRVTATAFVFLAYCVGNIIGPHAFLGKEAPVYQTGCKLIIGCCVGQAMTAFCLRLLLIRRNKQRDAAEAAAGAAAVGEDDDEAMQDLTDFENPKFRYSY